MTPRDPLKEAIDLYLERPEDFEPSPPTDGDLPFTAAQAASMAEWSQDPFDMDWAWVNPEVRKDGAATQRPSTESDLVSSSVNIKDRQDFRYMMRYAVPALAVAATLLVMFYWWPRGNTTSNSELIVASANVASSRGGSRGANEVVTYEIRSNRKGFLTVVGIHDDLRPDDTLVDPAPFDKSARVTPESPATFRSDYFPNASGFIFIVTETEADAAIRRGLSSRKSLPQEADALIAICREILTDGGFHWAEISSLRIEH